MALSLNQLSTATMDMEERHYFKAMGRRISQRRQELGLTQVELAATLDMPQQTYASYEIGSRRIPVSLLPALGQALTMDLESLLGVAAAHTKRGPAPKFQQYVERISQLPKAQQRVVLQMLDGLLAQSR